MNEEHRLDPAALDELMRAFGEVPDVGDDSAVSDETSPSTSGPTSDDVDADDVDADDVGASEVSDTTAGDASPEVLIVEQESLASEPAAAPPTVVRIDDYSGSVVIDSEPAPAPDVASDAPSTPVEATSDQSAPDSDGADPSAPGDPVVITIEDAELPDPLYIEGNLERSGSRSIVFIDDDESGDTVVPEVERDARRGIEPRLRERRAAVKRAIGRKRMRWILVIGSFVVVVVTALAVLGSSLFAIEEEHVTVVGAVYADPAQMAAVVDDLVGTPALLVDTQTAEERLEQIPWVEDARVRIDFPHTATIEIRERQAMTTYQGPDQRYRVLDREGRVLDVLDGYPIAYVLIAGSDPVDLDAGQFAPQGYAAASDLATSLTSSVRGRVKFIDVTADGSYLALQLDDGTLVRFGAARDLLDKLIRLETVLVANPEREPGPIDVSTSEVTL